MLYARFADDCRSVNKDTIQSDEDLPARLAVDGDFNTHSCTEDNEAFPWWSVDLGQEYSITSVTVIFPIIEGNIVVSSYFI